MNTQQMANLIGTDITWKYKYAIATVYVTSVDERAVINYAHAPRRGRTWK